MPRIVAIIDEFVRLFEFDDQISDRAYATLLDIALRGRAFGIHLILSAQRPVGSYQNLNPVKSQISVRVGFKCNQPDDSVLIMGEGNEMAAFLEGRGNACITYDPTIRRLTDIVKIALVTQDDRASILDRIRALARSRMTATDTQPVVFSKREPVHWQKSPAVSSLLIGPAASTPNPKIWLGEPVSLVEDLSLELQQSENSNLLIVGNSEEIASSILVTSLLGLCLTCSPRHLELLLLDTMLASQTTRPYWELFSARSAHRTETVDDVADALDSLLQRAEYRIEQRGPHPPVILVIPGLHRISEFRATDPYTPSPAGENLDKLLKLGPQVGIHALLWTDRVATLRSVVGAHEALDVFSHRIALHMSSDESNDLLRVPNASRLGTDLRRAYFRSEEWPEYAIEKIKPYEIPGLAEAADILSSIREKWELNADVQP